MSNLIMTIYSSNEEDNVKDEEESESIEVNEILENENNENIKENKIIDELKDNIKYVSQNKKIFDNKEENIENKSKYKTFLRNEKNWDDLNILKPIRKSLEEINFDFPSKIQEISIPTILNNNDVLGSSITGSGKTAAFLIPILQKIILQKNLYYTDNYSKCLIVLPTRELAIQCFEMLKKISKYSKISASLIIGKVSISVQENELIKGPDFIIATPGRIIDLNKNSKGVFLENIEILVFDEADKLLELGFQEEIKEINKICDNNKRQTLLFSATMNKNINKIINLTLKKPVILKADPDNRVSKKLIQIVCKLGDHEDLRESFNLYLLKKYSKDCKIINFFKTKEECHRMGIILDQLKINNSELHGNLNQLERIENLENFKNNKSRILLATDLAGRGLDIKEVNLVINYELPKELSRYIHRVGRTARAGNEGKCITIVNNNELPDLKKIIKKTKEKLFKEKIEKKIILDVKKEIKSLEGKIKRRKTIERLEKDLIAAQIQAKKAQNIMEYEKDIYNKPKKEWIMSNKKKIEIKKRSKKLFDLRN